MNNYYRRTIAQGIIKQIIFLACLLSCLAYRAGAQGFTIDRIKAEYTLLLSGYVSWADEGQYDNYRIGVLGAPLVYNELSFKSQMDQLKGKPFEAVYLKQINDISGIRILYVGQERNTDIRRIVNKIRGQPILMVTDSSSEYEYVMINLLAVNRGGKAFELNKKNIDEAGLSISDKVLILGGKEDDLREIYRASEKELEKVREELVLLSADIGRQKILLEDRKREIDTLNREIDNQKAELAILVHDISEQQMVLAEKNRILEMRETELRSKESEISSQNAHLEKLLRDIDSGGRILQEQRADMQIQARQIDAQRSVLERQTLTIERQKSILYLSGILIFLGAGLIFFIVRAYSIKKRANRILKEKNESIKRQNVEITRQKEEILAQREQLVEVNTRIERQNANITSSIYYALTIQQAILPFPEEIDRYFENFIVFLPKDIVSGDFYWISHIDRNAEMETFYIAVADCTGHGVPGGFLSMVGTRLLNAIVNESRIFEPGIILTELDERFRKALKQDRTENDDGMDLCLCRIERKTDRQDAVIPGAIKVCFAGARRPLFYISNNSGIIRLPGDPKPVGGRYHNDVSFTQKTLAMSSGDMLYLTTDGLADQSSPERKKFGNKRLMEVLSCSSHLSMEQQKMRLDEELLTFQKYEKQRDDITLVGIKL